MGEFCNGGLSGTDPFLFLCLDKIGNEVGDCFCSSDTLSSVMKKDCAFANVHISELLLRTEDYPADVINIES